MPKRRFENALGALAAALLALALALLAGCSSGSSPASSPNSASAPRTGASGFDGAAIPPSAPVRDFTLSDQRGARISLSRYRGKVTIVAFPYTTCGATCTLIAEQIRGALDELAHAPAVLLISADPVTDTPARARRFLGRTSLSGRAHYLTGTSKQLRAVWHSLRVVPASAGKRAFDQSASVFLLNGEGRERVIFQLEQLTPEALSHDVRRLRGGE